MSSLFAAAEPVSQTALLLFSVGLAIWFCVTFVRGQEDEESERVAVGYSVLLIVYMVFTFFMFAVLDHLVV